MKKLYILTVLCMLAFASCTKGVLDKLPTDIMTEEQVWKDPALINAYLTEAYAQTTVWESESSISPSMNTGDKHFYIYLIHAISDEAKSNSGWAGNAAGFKSGGIKISGGFLEWWEKPYSIIRNLNDFIARVPESPIDNNIKKLRVAEARFVRAYNYFSMCIRYGAVPLILKVLKKDDPEAELYPKRNAEQEVYDFIIKEMDELSVILPEKVADADYGRPSKYAALALKSRAALYAASIAKYGTVQLNGLLGIPAAKANEYYQKSIDASKTIMAAPFDLYNKYPGDKAQNYRQIFLDEKNVESIFVRPHNPTNRDAGGTGWQYDFFQCPKPNGWGSGSVNGVYLEMVEEYEYTDGRTGTLDRTAITTGLWTIEDLWKNKDPRFFASIYTQNTPWQSRILDFHNGILKPDGTVTTESYQGVLGVGQNGNTGFGLLKYLDENKSNMDASAAYSSGQDWILFRLAEIYLNYAEASFETGNSTEALIYVNKIRTRAGIAPLTTIDINKIRHERKIELAFEGHRYWDLRRWRIAKQELTKNHTGLRYILDFTTRKYKLAILPKLDGAAADPIFYDWNYYFPITLARTNANKNLVENPGYQ